MLCSCCCGSGACRNLKETSALHPENPAPKIVSPDSGAWRLGGPWGCEILVWTACQRRAMSRARYLDPHGGGMWLDEALDDRRREAIKIRSRPRPLRPGVGSGRRRLKTLKPMLSRALLAAHPVASTSLTRRFNTNRKAALVPLGQNTAEGDSISRPHCTSPGLHVLAPLALANRTSHWIRTHRLDHNKKSIHPRRVWPAWPVWRCLVLSGHCC